MRIRPGTSPEEVEAGLNDRQSTALYAALDHRSQEAKIQADLAASQQALRLSVSNAYQDGVPVMLLAQRLGLTDKRIYQMIATAGVDKLAATG